MSAAPSTVTPASAPAASAPLIAPRPQLTVRTEALMSIDDMEEIEVPVLELSFAYGNTVVRAADPRERLFWSLGGSLMTIERHRAAEDQAKRLLESFGAVELGCLEHYTPALDSTADYVVHVDANVHAYCSFSAYALPQLRALGWQIHLDPGYPYRVIEGDVPWYVDLQASGEGEQADWFNLELGISHQGKRVSLLPALLELLERTPEAGGLAALLRMATRCVALPVGDGVYLPLPAERLKRMLGIVRDLYEGSNTPAVRTRPEDAALSVGPNDAAALRHLEEAIGGGDGHIEWLGNDTLRQLGERLVNGPSELLAQPRGLRAELRSYQREGVAWLQHLRSLRVGGILADDMGLGKTLQTITHLLTEKEAGRLTKPVLVVAPTSLVPGWCREIEKFAPALRTLMLQGARRHEQHCLIPQHDVVVTSYPLLWRDIEVFEEHQFSMLVLDEAHAIKNRASRASQAVRSIPADLRLCLTGTPLENNLGELFSMFDFLVPGLLGNGQQFQSSFRTPIEMGDADRLEQLRRRVSPFILRRLKRDVASELPPKTEIVRPVDLPDDQRELYESIRVAAHAQVRSAIREKGLAASTLPVLDALMKLRQVCCHPRLVRVPAAQAVRGAAKYEMLLGLLRHLVPEGRRVLVFSQFARMLTQISEGLLAEGIRHVTLTGATTDRQAKVDAFQQGRADVFLISLKAGGTGLTLTAADTVIHYDPWWNPAAQAQATDRAYRIGQTKPVFVYKLIVAGSVEERMLQLQQRKQHLADAILGGTGACPPLSAEDVDDLFAPLD